MYIKKLIFLFFIGYTMTSFAQKDSLQLGIRYAEDQLYVVISYNQLFNQPALVNGGGFASGFSTGFMKDLTLNKQGSISMALGFGYNYDSFNHGLSILEDNNEVNFQVDNFFATNKLLVHNLEFPFEFRWRDSDSQTYKFWRVYMGLKASYNLSNNFKYTNGTDSFSYRNVSRYNTWQYGLTFSIGYDVFTAHAYYGLNSVLKNTPIETLDISSKMMRIGLIFYFL